MLRNAAYGATALCCAALLWVAAPQHAAALGRGLPSAPGQRRPAPTVPRRAGSELVKDLVKAWQITKGQGVTVAIIGGHVDPAAPGLSGKVTTGRGFGNYRHWARYDSTVFASAVAASGPSQQNPFGTVGLAPAARILSVRVPEVAKFVSWQSILSAAIRYAVHRGAGVIYLDQASYQDTVTLDSAIAYAVSKNAVIVCDEFGWGHKPNGAEYPNSLPGVAGAGTVILPGLRPPVRRHRAVANGSVLVAAPGNALAVTGPRGQGYLIYNWYAADAWLTATVALVKSVYHNLPPSLVEQALALSARDHPRDGYNVRVGYGLINPAGALQEAAKLKRLRPAAGPGAGAAGPGARLAAGPAPGAIDAVRHPLGKLAGFGGAVLAGLILLAFAARGRGRRRDHSPPGTLSPSGGPPGPGWPETLSPSPPQARSWSPPGTGPQSPPGTDVWSPPGTRPQSPPGTDVWSPPGTRPQSPPGTRWPPPPGTGHGGYGGWGNAPRDPGDSEAPG